MAVLIGADGNDTLCGGDGSETYYGDSTEDKVTESKATASISISIMPFPFSDSVPLTK